MSLRDDLEELYELRKWEIDARLLIRELCECIINPTRKGLEVAQRARQFYPPAIDQTVLDLRPKFDPDRTALEKSLRPRARANATPPPVLELEMETTKKVYSGIFGWTPEID